MVRPLPEPAFRSGVAAIAFFLSFFLGATAWALAAGPATVAVTAWKLALPSHDYADLPNLTAEGDYVPENDLRSLVFVCDKRQGGERFFILIVAPGFKHDPVSTVRLTLGDGGPSFSFELRDLYGAPGSDAPKLEWDADILYGEVGGEDLSEIAQVKSLTVSAAGRAWRLPLPGMAKAMPVFLNYCHTGKVSDRSVLAK